jgi:hypothetical protein
LVNAILEVQLLMAPAFCYFYGKISLRNIKSNGYGTDMSTPINSQELSRLHQWIDKLPPRQFTLIYHLVEELVEDDFDETYYLLSSDKMKERLLAARESSEEIQYEVVREKLGI